MGLPKMRLTCIGSERGGPLIYSILFYSHSGIPTAMEEHYVLVKTRMVFPCLMTRIRKIPSRSLVTGIISVASTFDVNDIYTLLGCYADLTCS
jgi:hypothetical protein